MGNYARIINGVAVDVCPDPATHFHPSLAVEFVGVPDSVRPGWVRKGDAWSAPVLVEPLTPAIIEQGNLQPTALQFLLMLTAAEQVAIREAAKSDPMVGVLVTMVDDPRLTFVDLTNATVIEGIQYLTTTTPALLTKERAARLLKGLGPVAAPADASESAS